MYVFHVTIGGKLVSFVELNVSGMAKAAGTWQSARMRNMQRTEWGDIIFNFSICGFLSTLICLLSIF